MWYFLYSLVDVILDIKTNTNNDRIAPSPTMVACLSREAMKDPCGNFYHQLVIGARATIRILWTIFRPKKNGHRTAF